jgi:hypothetical protein
VRDLRLDHVRIVWQDDTELKESGEPYEGCYAEATVSYQVSERSPDRRLETLTSGGLWGIDADPDDGQSRYRREVEREELADLKGHLQVFGVPLDGFDAKVLRP